MMHTRQFIVEHVEARSGVVTARAAIYAAYRAWCSRNEFWPQSQKAFVAAMHAQGFDQRGRVEETAGGGLVLSGFFPNVHCTCPAPTAGLAGLN